MVLKPTWEVLKTMLVAGDFNHPRGGSNPMEMRQESPRINHDQRTITYQFSKEVQLENFRVTDDCHGQHSHHHVNHIIMSTTSSSSSWEM